VFETWQVGDQTWRRAGSCIAVEVPPAPGPTPMAAPHHLLYVNRCVGGATYSSSWSDDSRANRSQIISGSKTLPEFPYDDATWNAMMQRIRRIYAPFDIEVTDVDPGDEPHAEAVVCGSAQAWGTSNGVLGISPWSCSIIPNSVSFIFPVDHGDDAVGLAETVTHEAAHAFTLEHEMICEDIMWWSSECAGDKYFYDQSAQCGDGSAESCSCGGQQNSYQDLLGSFGAGSPTPPTVTITAPSPSQQVTQGFVVRADVTDVYGALDRVELWIDGAESASFTSAPFIFNAPEGLAEGGHQVEVRAYNLFDAMGSDSVQVVLGLPCEGPDDCGDGETCVDGRCVAAPGTPGGLGEVCEEGDDCASGLCGDDGVSKVCIEVCEPALAGCPDGFSCVAAGADGVCWPSEGGGGGGGGCAASGGRAPLPLVLLIGLALALRGRRRRRSG
jgi:hypothetical protein